MGESGRVGVRQGERGSERGGERGEREERGCW